MDKYKPGLNRFIAIIIDGLIFIPLDWVHESIWGSNIPVYGFFVWAVFYSVSFVVYYVFMHVKFGQTIGKWICKVKVVDYESEKSINITQAILRDIVPVLLVPYSIYSYTSGYAADPGVFSDPSNGFDLIVAMILLFWVFLELITMLMNKKRRAVHDFIAGTVVIKVPNKPNSANRESTVI